MSKTSRLGLKVACFLFLAFVLLLVIDLFQENPSKFLSLGARAIGAAAALMTLVSLVLPRNESRGDPPRPLDICSRKLRHTQSLVDRTEQIAEVTKEIKHNEVVNCHGPQGAGKSFLLRYLADIVNGHRKPNQHHTWPQGISAALYFDLSDAIGFGGIESQVCRATFGQDGSWSQFIGYVDREYPGRRVLLILDNVNSRSLWTPVGRAVFEYLLAREGDKLVLGSIDGLNFDNLKVAEVDIEGLEVNAFIELATLEGLPLEEQQLVALHAQRHGLPYYAGPRGTRHAALAERVELAAGTRCLAAYAALLAVVTRPIPLSELEHCPIANFETHLRAAIGEKLVEPTADGRFLTMHDIAREDALSLFDREVPDAAAMLFERARQRREDVNAAVLAMFSDPEQIGKERFDEVLLPVIRKAVDSRNYALLESLYEKSRSNERLLEFLVEDRSRSDLFSFSRASQLAGLGSYEAAEAELLETSIAKSRSGHGAAPSELQLELRYLQADLAHLLNRYEEAALGFDKLAETAASSGCEQLRTKCVWAQAHVLRHQGRDLDRAMALFGQAEGLAEELNMLSVKSQCITGASMIKVFRGAVPDDEEERLERIEEEVAASQSHDGHMLGIWKALAQVDWIRGRKDKAMERIEDAIKKARVLNDRLLYDLLFERAEFLRLGGDGAAALDDYDRAFRFGTGNRDRNMTSIALLGLVLASIIHEETAPWVIQGAVSSA